MNFKSIHGSCGSVFLVIAPCNHLVVV
jgi:hypothetical protein